MSAQQDLAALYPFLEEAPVAEGSTALRDDLRRSTIAKLEESTALRRRVCREHASGIRECADAIAGALERGGTVFTFGNGGSSTDAGALAALLSNPVPLADPAPSGSEPPVGPAVAVTSETATITALANDIGYDNAIARVLSTLAGPHDVAVVISTSGNSENLVVALRTAARLGLLRVAFAGYDGGRFAEPGLVDHLFVVPSASVHRIQEAQTALYHQLAHEVAAERRRSRSTKGAPA